MTNWRLLALLIVPCASGCWFSGNDCDVEGGKTVHAGALDPSNACRSCQPSVNKKAYSPIADGTACGGGKICGAAQCQSACFVDGKVVAADAPNPGNACQSCQPASATGAFTARPDGTSCGNGKVCGGAACRDACFIAGAVVDADTGNTSNPCQLCQPGSSTTDWTARPPGTACGTGHVCNGTACASGCYIGSAFYAAGASNPGNACETCDPTRSTSAWSQAALGSACGAGKVCNGASCQDGCFIGGAVVAAGAASGANACQTCQPATSTAAYTPEADGTACGSGLICGSGTCTAGCFIAGAVVANGTADPANACQTCQSASSTTAWTALADGTVCASGQVCSSGTCQSGCYISGALVAPATTEPGNVCRSCQPLALTSGWTPVADGTSCTTCNTCTAGVCGPLVLAQGGSQPSGLTLAGNYGYYAEFYGQGVVQVDLDGGGAAYYATGMVNPIDTAILNGAVFALDYGGKCIRALYGDGGPGDVLGPLLEVPGSLYASGGRLFFTDHGDLSVGFPGMVGSMWPDGGDVQTYSYGGQPSWVLADANRVYWIDDSSNLVEYADLANDGGPITTIPAQGAPTALTDDANAIYWAAYQVGVFRMDKADGGIQPVVTDAGYYNDLASDGTYLYLSDITNSATGVVSRAPVDGSALVPLWSGSGAPQSLALGGQCLYFTTTSSLQSMLRTDR